MRPQWKHSGDVPLQFGVRGIVCTPHFTTSLHNLTSQPHFTTPVSSTIMIERVMNGARSKVDSVLAALSQLAGKLPAVEDRSGTRTRGELRRAVEHAHAYFSRIGIGVGQRVAIVTGDDKRVVAALLGARA